VTDITYILSRQAWFGRRLFSPACRGLVHGADALPGGWCTADVGMLSTYQEESPDQAYDMSDDWLRSCLAHNLDSRMSRRGNRWDNAIVESFFKPEEGTHWATALRNPWLSQSGCVRSHGSLL